MAKRHVQVSKDHGLTWKKRWIDPAEFDPSKSTLVAGEWVRRSEHDHILVITIRDGKLYGEMLQITHKFVYRLTSGEEVILHSEKQQDADSAFVEILISRGLLQRTKEEVLDI